MDLLSTYSTTNNKYVNNESEINQERATTLKPKRSNKHIRLYYYYYYYLLMIVNNEQELTYSE